MYGGACSGAVVLPSSAVREIEDHITQSLADPSAPSVVPAGLRDYITSHEVGH